MPMTFSDRSSASGRAACRLAIALFATSASIPLSAQQRIPASAPANAEVSASARATAPTPPPRPTEIVTGTGPNGAKMRCRDGSYEPVAAPENACDAKGGVLVRFPLRRVPQPAPRLPRISAPAVAAAAPAGAERTADALRATAASGGKGEVAAPGPPADATLLCGDGSFIVADTARVRCAGKGGVSVIYPQRRRP